MTSGAWNPRWPIKRFRETRNIRPKSSVLALKAQCHHNRGCFECMLPTEITEVMQSRSWSQPKLTELPSSFPAPSQGRPKSCAPRRVATLSRSEVGKKKESNHRVFFNMSEVPEMHIKINSDRDEFVRLNPNHACIEEYHHFMEERGHTKVAAIQCYFCLPSGERNFQSKKELKEAKKAKKQKTSHDEAMGTEKQELIIVPEIDKAEQVFLFLDCSLLTNLGHKESCSWNGKPKEEKEGRACWWLDETSCGILLGLCPQVGLRIATPTMLLLFLVT